MRFLTRCKWRFARSCAVSPSCDFPLVLRFPGTEHRPCYVIYLISVIRGPPHLQVSFFAEWRQTNALIARSLGVDKLQIYHVMVRDTRRHGVTVDAGHLQMRQLKPTGRSTDARINACWHFDS